MGRFGRKLRGGGSLYVQHLTVATLFMQSPVTRNPGNADWVYIGVL